MDRPEVRANLPEVRRAEMAAAAGVLGVEHRWLGFVDSGWPDGGPLPEGSFAALPLQEATAPLVRLMREFRPHVVLTYDENGGYPHPDHIRCHEVSVAAFDAAAEPDRFAEAGPPWRSLKLYYVHEWCRARMAAFHDALVRAGLESPYGNGWLAQWDVEQPDTLRRVTTRVPCGDYFERRDAALRAHATQIDPNSHWFAVPVPWQRELWPTEDYELVRSDVDTPVPEDDLLAGVLATSQPAGRS
jgi:mycothiol S-conjugate amidase